LKIAAIMRATRSKKETAGCSVFLSSFQISNRVVPNRLSFSARAS
jgi:hypothetical protein